MAGEPRVHEVNGGHRPRLSFVYYHIYPSTGSTHVHIPIQHLLQVDKLLKVIRGNRDQYSHPIENGAGHHRRDAVDYGLSGENFRHRPEHWREFVRPNLLFFNITLWPATLFNGQTYSVIERDTLLVSASNDEACHDGTPQEEGCDDQYHLSDT